MTAPPQFGFTVRAHTPLYRITSRSHYSANPAHHPSVVDGRNSRRTARGGRYNFPGVTTVYLAEKPETAVAEMLLYFHKDTLRLLDLHQISSLPVPPFAKKVILWEIELQRDIQGLFDMNQPGASSSRFVYRAFISSPYHDYWHLCQRRAEIEAAGYEGIYVTSARDPTGGNIIVLFNDQSGNVSSITPYELELQLLTSVGTLFNDAINHDLDFGRAHVSITSSTAPLPSWATSLIGGKILSFNH